MKLNYYELIRPNVPVQTFGDRKLHTDTKTLCSCEFDKLKHII